MEINNGGYYLNGVFLNIKYTCKKLRIKINCNRKKYCIFYTFLSNAEVLHFFFFFVVGICILFLLLYKFVVHLAQRESNPRETFLQKTTTQQKKNFLSWYTNHRAYFERKDFVQLTLLHKSVIREAYFKMKCGPITQTRLFKYIENFTTKKGIFSDKKC